MAFAHKILQAQNPCMRLKLLKVLVTLGFLAGFLLSPMLWRNEGRLLETLKPIDAIPTLPAPFDLLLLIVSMLALVSWILVPRRFLGLMAIVGLAYILLQDQMRWQPWAYLYLLLLIPLLRAGETEEGNKIILQCVQLIVAGVYLWSGLHKFQANFIGGPHAQMILDMGITADFDSIKKTGYFIPLIESGMAVALLIPKFRKAGIIAAIGMHLFIILYLSCWAAVPNTVVYPWNVTMIFVVLLLFWGVRERSVPPLNSLKIRSVAALPVVLVWLLPLLNHWGLWDHYLSFSFYSNKPAQYFVAVKDAELDKMDQRYAPYFDKAPGIEGGKILDMNRFALKELNVPFYPELRCFQQFSRQFNTRYKGDTTIRYIEMAFTDGEPSFTGYSYADLQKR